MTSLVVPPGWPGAVRPAGAPRWEESAQAWLLDVCPPEYRGYPPLRRHPTVLARLAVLYVEGCRAGSKRALSEVRADLRHTLTPDVVDAAVQVLLTEDARWAALHREVSLVEEALGGRRFRARL